MRLRDEDCNNCPFVDINEDRQRWLQNNGVKTALPHYCLKFNRKLRHVAGAAPRDSRVQYESYKLERCKDCFEIGFIERFEYNP